MSIWVSRTSRLRNRHGSVDQGQQRYRRDQLSHVRFPRSAPIYDHGNGKLDHKVRQASRFVQDGGRCRQKPQVSGSAIRRQRDGIAWRFVFSLRSGALRTSVRAGHHPADDNEGAGLRRRAFYWRSVLNLRAASHPSLSVWGNLRNRRDAYLRRRRRGYRGHRQPAARVGQLLRRANLGAKRSAAPSHSGRASASSTSAPRK